MLSFDIRAVGSKAAHVSGTLAPDDEVWQDGDPRPSGPIKVEGRLSSAGGGRFYFSGTIAGDVEQQCRRCLNAVAAAADEEMQAVFAPSDDEDVSDPDVFTFDPAARELDIRPAVREMWLLSVPRFVLCSEECKGFCPQCGTDLNSGTCDCDQSRDSRWDALRKATSG